MSNRLANVPTVTVPMLLRNAVEGEMVYARSPPSNAALVERKRGTLSWIGCVLTMVLAAAGESLMYTQSLPGVLMATSSLAVGTWTGLQLLPLFHSPSPAAPVHVMVVAVASAAGASAVSAMNEAAET